MTAFPLVIPSDDECAARWQEIRAAVETRRGYTGEEWRDAYRNVMREIDAEGQ